MEKLQDTLFGLSKEKEVLETLKAKIPAIVQLHRYNTFDFECDEYIFELKSRNCFYQSFSTTMIGFNKIREAKTQMKPVIMLFLFIDGLYYWEIKENEYTTKTFKRTRDNRDEISLYAYIDIDKLKPFEKFMP